MSNQRKHDLVPGSLRSLALIGYEAFQRYADDNGGRSSFGCDASFFDLPDLYVEAWIAVAERVALHADLTHSGGAGPFPRDVS